MQLSKYLIAIAGIGFVAALAVQPAAAQRPEMPLSHAVAAKDVQFKDLGGPQLGTIWGDSGKGAHGSFLRLPAGFVSPVHLHSDDYDAVIVEGTVSNAEAGAKALALGPGSYYVQKGKVTHVTSCLSVAPCLLYVTQRGPFDFITPGA